MTETACEFVPAHEPWQCSVHPGGYRTSLNEGMCRAAQAETVQPLTPVEIEEFDRWAESRKGKGVSLGMLWALRLRATLDAARAQPSPDLATLDMQRRSMEALVRRVAELNVRSWQRDGEEVVTIARADVDRLLSIVARARQLTRTRQHMEAAR